MFQHFALIVTTLLVSSTDLAADSADSVQLTLPPEIYAVPGVPTSIYFDNIILSQDSSKYRFDVRCEIGRTDARRWRVTPTPDAVGSHSFSITVSTAEGVEIDTKTTTLHVVDSGTESNSKSIRLLIIGDSLTHASVYPNEIAELMKCPGNPRMQMIGTHHPASAADGVFHEGYGGWTWDRFLTKYEPNPDGTYRKRSSPFVFADDTGKPSLNVPLYIESHCDGTPPDFIVIMLGINDCFSAPADDRDGMDVRIDSMFDNADRLLAAIQEAAPEAQIGLCLTTPPNSRKAAFEANYQGRYPRWGWKKIQHRLVQRQLDYVAAKGDPRITIIPTQLNLDVVDGYPENNAVHPNAAGYQQIGATVYSWLKYRMAKSSNTADDSGDAFLLPYFLGNGETGIFFAYSVDGLKFEWLNDGRVVMPAPSWGDESLTRDPSILYRDGRFHMVWTTSWNALTIGYASSKDLIHWSKPQKIQIWQDRTDVRNTWAPELHWDPEEREYIVIWSSTTLAELNDNDGTTDPHGHDHRTWASRTKDFKTWTRPELFFVPEPEHGVIDPFIAHDDRNTSDPDDDRWVMVIKHEMAEADGGKNLRLTFGPKMQGPFDTKLSPPIVGAGTTIVNQMGEGPSLFKRDGLWHLYWDAPGSDFSYCLATSPDLETWTNRSQEMSLPAKQMRHGTVVVVPRRVVEKATPETSP